MDISLVILCYNEASHLRKSVSALLEVLDQTRYKFEVLFVNDCSQDNTREIIKDICSHINHCRYVFHESNLSRGGAFKIGFKETNGRITGFIDIDLEINALYIPFLVNFIDKHDFDVVTGYRHYILSQTGHIFRKVFSRTYRIICRAVIKLSVSDSETGIKFFKRSTTTNLILGCKSDGWFWDTEVMTRASLSNLRIHEVPVLFLKNSNIKSTVRLPRDCWNYLIELKEFRKDIGLSLTSKSPVYWTSSGYDLVMKLLYKSKYKQLYYDVGKLIEVDSSIIDICCGTCRLYFDYLKNNSQCKYLGLDLNVNFIKVAQNRGANVSFFNLYNDNLPFADYIVMIGSFYQFYSREEEILLKLKKAARKAVIISEPIKNVSKTNFKPAVIFYIIYYWLAKKIDYQDTVKSSHRYNHEEFRAFANKHEASNLIYHPENKNCIAIFESN